MQKSKPTNVNINQLQSNEQRVSTKAGATAQHSGVRLLAAAQNGQQAVTELKKIIKELLNGFETQHTLEFYNKPSTPFIFVMRISMKGIELHIEKETKKRKYQFNTTTTLFKIDGKEADITHLKLFFERVGQVLEMVGNNQATYVELA
ncbi:MAG: hypothetical protein ACON35_05380 [Candidatus Marinamargulisbacteria bacterium]